jgi:anti-sigma factor RsiW
MTCDEVTPALLAWQLGACASPEREQIEEHVKGCAACLAKLFATKRLTEDAAAFDERPSPVMRERLRARVKQRASVKAPRRVTWVMGLAAAAALIILGLVGWRALSSGSLSTPPSAAGNGLVDVDGPANLDVL